MLNLFKGNTEFWKCFLVFLLFSGLTAALYLKLLPPQYQLIDWDLKSGDSMAPYLTVCIFIWLATSLYRCADNARWAIGRWFGKSLGFIVNGVIVWLVAQFGLGGIIFGVFYFVWFLFFIVFE